MTPLGWAASGEHMVRSLTWDQGRETARRADIEAAPDIEVCFCGPRHRPAKTSQGGQCSTAPPTGFEPVPPA